MILKITDMGLVAYMQMKGCRLLRYTNNAFEVATESKNDAESWAIDYSNSCCFQHDKGILSLRNLVRSNRRQEVSHG